MSSPAELRVLCQQLSSTSNAKLPQITSILLRNVLRCQGPLSSGASLASKSDSSESSVLIHKFKTQISTFLQGKSFEARYTAAALIKAVVDVGGWEVLREADSWVRGLLMILGKPDPVATKKLCILSLTSIYLKVHQYQTLAREIATPTLPNFVLSCLNQLTSTSSGRDRDIAPFLRETVFESFSVLVRRYPTIFRPYNKQIRTELRAYLAPTLSDGHFITTSLGKSARRLAILLYQSAAKNGSGEEWVNGIKDLVKKIHSTIDQVYRAVIEDWEPSDGYISQYVNMDEEVHGGAKSGEDLPLWNGIDAGLERLVGFLGLLADHFKYQTVAAITVPLGSIVGLLTRLMSVVPPSNWKQNSEHSEMRLHPAVERIERERLWAGLPSVYVASMEVYLALAQRLHHNFTSMAQPCLLQMAWTFTHVPYDENFRTAMYQLVFRILPLCGSSLQQSVVDLMSPIIKACCNDVRNVEDDSPLSKDETRKGLMSRSSVNVDTFLTNKASKQVITMRRKTRIVDAAEKLHPLFLTHIPQQCLQGYLRAEVDRTSILVHHKDGMLASVLHPFIGKNGKVLPSIMPHLCREFSGTSAVEAMLRPRQPVVFPTQTLLQDQLSLNGVEIDEDEMEDVVVADNPSFNQSLSAVEGVINKEGVTEARNHEAAQIIQTIAPDEEDSDESVHLTMELSDSEDEQLS